MGMAKYMEDNCEIIFERMAEFYNHRKEREAAASIPRDVSKNKKADSKTHRQKPTEPNSFIGF